jgi:hypothetical protein
MKLTATLLLFGASAWAQQVPVQTSNPATGEVQNYALEANSFIEALLKISAQFYLPMGVEWKKTPDTLKPVQFSRSRTTVADILDSVVSLHAGYEWRTEDGVVHVFQRDLVNDNRNPLNITIKSFHQNPQTVGFANAVLDQMVRYPKQNGIAVSVLGSPNEPVFSFAAQNVPARNVLNQIITSGLRILPQPPPGMNRIWIATFPENQVLGRDGYFEAVPIWNPTYVAKESQPIWILLRWGVPPPEKMVK